MKKGLIKKKKNVKKTLVSHFIILLLLFGINIWDRLNNIPRFPKNFLYLTQIDLYLSFIYFLLVFILDLCKKESKKFYQKLFNFCFVLSFIVFIMFWSMFFIKRDTLYGDGKNRVPFILTFLLHGGVFICNLLEQIIIGKRKSPEYINQIIYFIFTIAYIGGLSLIYYLFELKIYPFIYGSLFSFFIVCLGGFLCSLIGHRIYMWMTGGPAKQIDSNNYVGDGNDTDESLNSYNE